MNPGEGNRWESSPLILFLLLFLSFFLFFCIFWAAVLPFSLRICSKRGCVDKISKLVAKAVVWQCDARALIPQPFRFPPFPHHRSPPPSCRLFDRRNGPRDWTTSSHVQTSNVSPHPHCLPSTLTLSTQSTSRRFPRHNLKVGKNHTSHPCRCTLLSVLRLNLLRWVFWEFVERRSNEFACELSSFWGFFFFLYISKNVTHGCCQSRVWCFFFLCLVFFFRFVPYVFRLATCSVWSHSGSQSLREVVFVVRHRFLWFELVFLCDTLGWVLISVGDENSGFRWTSCFPSCRILFRVLSSGPFACLCLIVAAFSFFSKCVFVTLSPFYTWNTVVIHLMPQCS